VSTVEGLSTVRTTPGARRLGLGRVARALVLRGLEAIDDGQLSLTLPDGTLRRYGIPGERSPVSATVTSDDFFRRLATGGQIGLGESYVAGDWHADGDLAELFELLVRNAEHASRRRPYSTLLRLKALRPHVPVANGFRRARKHIHYHYDLGNDLFRLFLDESLTYSCAYFEHEGQPLADAQQAKYGRLCEKLLIGADDHVLEIGCGWGGFAIHAAREHGARVTGVTISSEQHELASARVRDAGLEGLVDIRFQDYRLLEGRFTKIVSIEMFEAIGERQFGTFFATCDRLLAPAGTIGLQVICVPDQRYASYRRSRDWIREYVFPGSLIPSLTAIARAMTQSSDLIVEGLEDIGIHYADTLRTWRDRFFAQHDDVLALGYDERFVRIWEYYLASCEALFRTRALRDLQLVLSRPFNDRLPRYPQQRITF
jgi:cyclopropane-fatty-acyl-phospholipid synthase